MIKFNELRITNDGNLYIDIAVYHIENPDTKVDYFKDVYIKRIRVFSYTTYQSEHNFGEPLFDSDTYINPISGTTEIAEKLATKVKEYKLWLSSIDLNNADMLHTLFFVVIDCDGAADECIPCVMQKESTVGVVWNNCLMVSDMMSYGKDILNNPCHEVPTDMILTYLTYELLTYTVKTCNYTELVELWKRIVEEHTKDSFSRISNNHCGCSK